MNYMWEALLQGEEQGIAKEDIWFTPARTANPYREVFFKDFNKSTLSGEPVDVNAYYRYGDILGLLLNEDIDCWPEIQSALFNLLAHYLSEMDLRSGLCRAEYYACFLREDIECGHFGPKYTEVLSSFPKAQERFVLFDLLKLYRVGPSLRVFAQLLRELYPRSIVYFDTCGRREILIYIGKAKNSVLEKQIDTLCDLFLPINLKIHIFWELHFGLIGVNETLEIGDVMIF